jgi:transposase
VSKIDRYVIQPLIKRREQLHYTQADLAHALDVGRSLSRRSKATTRPSAIRSNASTRSQGPAVFAPRFSSQRSPVIFSFAVLRLRANKKIFCGSRPPSGVRTNKKI